MIITQNHIEAALRIADIEGLLKLGAPGNEYSSETSKIAAALTKIPSDQLTKEKITAVIALVWAKYFGLSGDDIEKRLPVFQHIADLLLAEAQPQHV